MHPRLSNGCLLVCIPNLLRVSLHQLVHLVFFFNSVLALGFIEFYHLFKGFSYMPDRSDDRYIFSILNRFIKHCRIRGCSSLTWHRLRMSILGRLRLWWIHLLNVSFWKLSDAFKSATVSPQQMTSLFSQPLMDTDCLFWIYRSYTTPDFPF